MIRGWDDGVAQLSVGQRAKLVCSPDYAYGARGKKQLVAILFPLLIDSFTLIGHPGIIPPNATLTFDVELLRVE